MTLKNMKREPESIKELRDEIVGQLKNGDTVNIELTEGDAVHELLESISSGIQGTKMLNKSSSRLVPGGGMYGTNPSVRIGKFTISDNGNGKIWIDDNEEDAGEFLADKLESTIKEFYDKNF